MPNKFKGTFDIKIRDEVYRLRPTFDAMEEMATLTGLSENVIFNKLREGDYSLKLITDILYSGIQGEFYASNREAKRVDRRLLGQYIMMDGVSNFATIAMQFVMFGVTAYEDAVAAIDRMNENEEAEKEDEGDPQKKTHG